MPIIMYGYPKCGTCRNAQKWLIHSGADVEIRDISTSPPSAEELTTYMELGGFDIAKLFNTSGLLYKEWKLKDKLPGMKLDEKLKLLEANGMLIKRPIVSDGRRVTLGFREEEYEQVWGNTAP